MPYQLTEPILAAMRSIRSQSDRCLSRYQDDVRAMGMRIPAGCAHFDAFVRGECLAEFLRHLPANGPAEAAERAKAYVRECVEKHNARRPKDVNWQRWEQMEDSTIEAAMRTILRAGEED